MIERKLRNFDGTKVVFNYDDETANERVLDELINPFAEKLESAWLCGTRGNKAENHVKNYISHIASILIAGEHGEILSERTLSRRRAREVPESAIDHAAQSVRPATPKRHRYQTQYDKIRKIKKKYPGCELSWIRVDVDGGFDYDGVHYRVVDNKYAGKRLKGFDGLYYQFDRVWVVKHGNQLAFYDQSVNDISRDHIFRS